MTTTTDDREHGYTIEPNGSGELKCDPTNFWCTSNCINYSMALKMNSRKSFPFNIKFVVGIALSNINIERYEVH